MNFKQWTIQSLGSTINVDVYDSNQYNFEYLNCYSSLWIFRNIFYHLFLVFNYSHIWLKEHQEKLFFAKCIISYIQIITWHFSYHTLFQPEVMISARELIKGMIWKMTCYDMLIIYFNRGNNWFVPKCKLVILARIKYMYIVIEQENYCFNIQIQ